MRTTSISAIACVSKNWGIGKDNKLLFHLPEDMKFFKEKTMGNTVIYGNSTLKSFPNKHPLPGRINIVISHDYHNIPQETIDYCDEVILYTEAGGAAYIKDSDIHPETIITTAKALFIASSIRAAIFLAKLFDHDIFICGGESIYKQAIKYCSNIYLTIVDQNVNDADAYFPNIDEDDNWKMIYATGPLESSNGIKYGFVTYENLYLISIFDIIKKGRLI